MGRRFSSNPFIWWVLAGTFALIFFIIGLTISVLAESRTVSNERLQNDSVANLSFQLEREYLRFRHAIELLRARGEKIDGLDWQELEQRYEIFVSRVVLLHDGPSITQFQDLNEYQDLTLQLNDFLSVMDPWMKLPHRRHEFLAVSAQKLEHLSDAVQNLSFAVNKRVLLQIEQRHALALRLQKWVIAFAGTLLCSLLAAAIALIIWHRKQRLVHADLQRLNDDLSKARDAAVAANLAKSRFVANMSHELRTPFNGMLGALQLLDHQSMSLQQKELLHTARQSADNLLQLLSDVLDLSAIDVNKLTFRLAPNDMREVVDSVVTRLHPAVEKKGLELFVSMNAPTMRVQVDATRVRQVLFNMLCNAVKFTEHGTISLSVEVRRQENKSFWRMQVHDSGPGVSVDMQNRLFMRFQQADASMTREHEGAGLGLEICRSLARLMGGDVVYVPKPSGACFVFTLRADVCMSQGETQQNSDAPFQTAAHQRQRPLKVLVAEDHPVNARLLIQQLSQLGHDATWAENGQAALDLLSGSEPFDLVLMDIHMPVLDGMQATRVIRSDARLRELPVFAVTADVMGNARERYLGIGMSGVLEKPYQKKDLEKILETASYSN